MAEVPSVNAFAFFPPLKRNCLERVVFLNLPLCCNIQIEPAKATTVVKESVYPNSTKYS